MHNRKRLQANRRRAFGLNGLGVAALVVLIGAGALASIAWDNRRYAKIVFLPVVNFEKVLASRRWLNPEKWISSFTGAQTPVCTYAVVALSSETDVKPPQRFLPARKYPQMYIFGQDDWSATPGPALKASPLAACEADLGTPLFQRVSQALEVPGAWWAEGPETLFLYAPSDGIAARLTIGDTL